MSVSLHVLEKARKFLIDEGVIALSQMRAATEYIWQQRPNAPGFLISDGEMINALRRLVSNFGLASTILFDGGAKRTSENSGVYAIRMDRFRYVEQLTSGIDTSIFSMRSIRNKFMHVDEHMAKELLKDDGAWVLNIGLGNRAVINCPDGPINYCRVYVFDEDRLLHLGEEFSVRAAFDAAGAIIDRLPPSHEGIEITPGGA